MIRLWQTTVFKVLCVEMYVNVVFVMSCLYSAVGLENSCLCPVRGVCLCACVCVCVCVLCVREYHRIRILYLLLLSLVRSGFSYAGVSTD